MEITYSVIITLPPPGRGTKYCDERVCMSVCPSVCPLTYRKTIRPNFTEFSVHVAGVRFTSDDSAIRYVLPGSRMTVIFAIMGHGAWLMGV